MFIKIDATYRGYKKGITLPNQELSGAKSELQGGTVGVCSSYKRGGQPPYNLPAAPLSVYATKPASVFTCAFQ